MSFNLGDLNPVRILAGKGEIGKSGLGPALATLALDYFAPGLGESITGLSGATGTAALVGGGTALASGSIQKGLMAGLSAYGTEELAGAAQSGISDATARSIDFGDIADSNPVTPLTTGEKLTAGLQGVKGLPTADLLKYGAMAAAPVLTAQSKSGLPSNPTNAGAYIRPKAYDPVSHRYYDLPAVKAGDWGSQSIADYVNSQVAPANAAKGGLMAAYADGGFATVGSDGLSSNPNPNPASGPAGQLAYNNEPVMRMARGGIARFDDGGNINSTYSPDVINNYIAQNNLSGDALTAAEQQFGVTPAQVAYAQNLSSPAAAQTQGGMPEPMAARNEPSAVADTPTGGTPVTPAYTSYTPDQIAAYIRTSGINLNDPAAIAAAEKTSNIDPAAYNAFAASNANPFSYQSLSSPTAANVANFDASLGTNPANIAIGNAVHTAYANTGATSNLAGNVAGNTQLAKEMDTWNVPPAQMAAALKMDPATIQKLYDAVNPNGKFATKASVTPGGTQSSTATTYVDPTTGVQQGFGNYGSGNQTGVSASGKTVSTATPGDIITNADQSRTVVSNTPGRPYGGFTGMEPLINAYTAGGGHLGQVLKPTQTYQNTGGSKAAYDYLSGAGTWAGTKTQPDAKVRNTYSNITSPSASEKTMYSKYPKVWVNGALVDNPYYSSSTTISGNGPVANLINQVGSTTANPDSSGADRVKNGGLLSAMAAGGMSDGHLGGYSDGGRLLRGPGDGVSDSIPATIGGKQPARLADGEFVVPARIVSELGNGSTEAGAKQLYAMMDRVQKARGKTVGKGKVAKSTRADKYLPA